MFGCLLQYSVSFVTANKQMIFTPLLSVDSFGNSSGGVEDKHITKVLESITVVFNTGVKMLET